MGARARWIIAFMAWLSLLVAALEIVLRIGIASPRHQHSDPVMGSVRDPGRRVVHSSEGYSVSHTNSAGWFDDEPSPTPPRIRGVLFGDSYSEALQVPREERFASLIEARIAGLELLNTGTAGWAPPHYVRLSREIEPHPDLAIVQLEDGDLEASFRASSLHFVSNAAVAGGFRLAPGQPGRTYRTLQRLTRPFTSHSAIANVAIEKLRWIASPGSVPGANGDALSVEVSEATEAMTWTFAEIGRVAPVVLVVYVPRIDYRGDCHRAEDVARSVFETAAARNGIEFLDPTAALCQGFERSGPPGQGFHNASIEEGHLNASGHRIVAEVLARTIEASFP